MSKLSRLKYAYWAYFSKPKSVRQLYRCVARQQPRKVVELGIRNLADTVRLLQVADRYAEGEPISYTGIDCFEMRPADQPTLGLKQAHQTLKQAELRPRLLPGEPATALAGVANSLLETDLVLLTCESADSDPLGDAWFYLPRMLHGGSVVLQISPGVEPGEIQLAQLDQVEIERRSRAPRRRAA